MKKILFFGGLIIHSILFSQNAEELIKKLPSLSGKEKATTLSDICYYLSVKDPSKAIEYGKQAATLSQQLGDTLLYAYCLNDLSAAYYYHSNYDSAIHYATIAYNIFLKYNKKRNAAGSLTKIANSYFEKAEYNKSIEYNQKALELFKAENRPTETALLLVNIGSVYDKLHQFPFAKKMYLDAANIAQTIPDTTAYFNAMGGYAAVLIKEDSLNKALDIFLKLIPIAEKINDYERSDILYQNIGNSYKKMNDFSKALYYLEKSNQLAEKISDKSSLSINNINIGICYTMLNDFLKSEAHLKKGISIADSIKNKLWLKTGYFALYEMYKRKKDFEKANLALEKAYQLEEEIFKDEVNKEIAEFQTKYKTIEMEAVILEQKNKLYQQELSIQEKNKFIYLLTGGISISILLSIVVYQRQRFKRKNAELQSLKKIQEEKQRIAKDLHDNLGAELTLIGSLIELKSLHSDNLKDKNELNEISEKVRTAAMLMRDTIWTTMNEHLNISQIGNRIKNFADKLSKPKNIKVHYHFNGEDISLNPQITLNLYRSIQEVINNAIKYSQAKNLNINIFSTKKNIQIKVEDDGIGFNKEKTSEGYGIQNIFSRANVAGFSVQLQTEKDKGTSYEFIIPIQS